MRLIVAMTGATGAVLGIRTLERLRALGVETHLIMSQWSRATVEMETDYTVAEVRALADVVHSPKDQAAAISSGSFRTDGMLVVPCSMKTAAAIRMGYGEGLIARAADVTLKERRLLVLSARETPLSQIHLENLLELSRMGVAIVPPMPAFYNQPKSLEEVIDYSVTRLLDQFGLAVPDARRWSGSIRPAQAHNAIRPIKPKENAV